MSKKNRKLPAELRMPNGDRFIPIPMRIVSKHENGMPYELECLPDDDSAFEIVAGDEFAVVYGRDVTFPGVKR